MAGMETPTTPESMTEVQNEVRVMASLLAGSGPPPMPSPHYRLQSGLMCPTPASVPTFDALSTAYGALSPEEEAEIVRVWLAKPAGMGGRGSGSEDEEEDEELTAHTGNVSGDGAHVAASTSP
mmetsp:Transcript_34320/g.67040  ORF Transcript_34320/g.67040 Transcript_34320/m.67040 type:complete len:123 (+) Transcript_34320:70-438(+)